MKKRARFLTILALAVLLVLAVVTPVVAHSLSTPVMKGELYLYAKTPLEPGAGNPWPIAQAAKAENEHHWKMKAGPAGRMDFQLSTSPDYSKYMLTFKFKGWGLGPKGTSYALVNYKGWPNVTILGTGVANGSGKVFIKGMTTVPLVSETPADPVTPGAKIWLVPSDQLSGSAFVAWDPTKILFEGVGMPILATPVPAP
jgi:hypothetical protein